MSEKLFRLSTGSLSDPNATSVDRVIEAVISTEELALDKIVIRTAGIDVGPYMQNPVVPFSHNTDEPPVAKMLQLFKRGTMLVGRMQFADDATYPFADTIFRLVKGGFLNAMSLSWIPLEARPLRGGPPGAMEHLRSLFLEASVVVVPANSEALVTARAGGIDTTAVSEWAERALQKTSTNIDKKGLIMIRDAAAANRKFYAAGPTDRQRTVSKGRALTAFGHRSDSDDFGKFLQRVARAESGGAIDKSLIRAPSGASEVDPTGGGFVVPEVFLEDLLGSLYEESVILPLVTKLNTDKPLKTSLPAIDETSRAEGSRWGGAASYWLAEASAVPPSLPRFRKVVFEGKKLAGLLNVTNEMLEDAPLLGFNMRRAYASEFGYKLDSAIFSGDGVGKPSGILNSNALIAVAAEVGQKTKTIVTENVDNMWARLPTPCRKRAVWLISEDGEKQLSNMISPANGGPLYMPAGIHGNEFPLLKGRPVLAIEQAAALGSVGDLVLCDLSQYYFLETPMLTALSMHVSFNSDQSVFRFILRVDGAPGWSSPITAANGSGTRSPYVALAAR